MQNSTRKIVLLKKNPGENPDEAGGKFKQDRDHEPSSHDLQ